MGDSQAQHCFADVLKHLELVWFWFGFGFETLAAVKILHLRTRKRELFFFFPQEGSRAEEEVTGE